MLPFTGFVITKRDISALCGFILLVALAPIGGAVCCAGCL